VIGPLRIDPPVLQAPLAGFTNYAYRQMLRRFGGVGLPATEMVSARGFMHMRGGKGVGNRLPSGKGVRNHLCDDHASMVPAGGPFRQMVPDTFSAPIGCGVSRTSRGR